jgi:hypothetical protein
MANFKPIMNNGIPLIKDGNPKAYDADLYPFGPPDECCCCPCCACEIYEFDLSGVTGGFGSQCTMADGHYELSTALECGPWTGENENLVDATLTRRSVEVDEMTICYYELVIGPLLAPAQGTYRLSAGEWECDGTNVMTFYSETGICNWPATVTVSCQGAAPFAGLMMSLPILEEERRARQRDAKIIQLAKSKDVQELFPDADPTLLGNRITALTTAIGFPPCGGCENRKKWLNSAHQWLRDLTR